MGVEEHVKVKFVEPKGVLELGGNNFNIIDSWKDKIPFLTSQE